MSDAFADVPVATDEQDDSELWLVALVVVLLLVNGNATSPLSATQRKRARNLLRTKFEDDALRLAQRLVAGQLTLEAWQRAVWQAIDDYTRQMAVAGAGQMPQPDTRQVAIEELQRQRPYLEGFAAVAGALSVAALAARTRFYGKSPWGVYYVAQSSTAGEGIVDRWVTRDDKFVCRNCAPLHGRYFLPTDGPWPGWACLGVCRCERVQVMDRALWERLGGRRAA